jgi:ubiquinol-cytochrome c reductase cytochrome c subunit
MRAAFLLACAALALPGLAAAEPPPPVGIVHANAPSGTPLKEVGAQLYAGNCVSCHGDRGEGVPQPRKGGVGDIVGAGPPLRGVGALAADFYLRTGYMPLESYDRQPRRSRVLFTGREIDALVAYVASLGKGPAVAKPHPERGSLAEGLHLFTDHCAGCHQVAGEGGTVTGALAPPLHQATATQIAEAVRVGPYVMPSFQRSQISDRQLDSIVRYVLYSKHPVDKGGWGIGHIGPVPEGLVAWLIAGTALVAVALVIGRRLHE